MKKDEEEVFERRQPWRLTGDSLTHPPPRAGARTLWGGDHVGTQTQSLEDKNKGSFCFQGKKTKKKQKQNADIVGNCAAPRFHTHESRPITLGVSKLDSQKAFSVSRKDLSTNFKNVFIGFWRGSQVLFFRLLKAHTTPVDISEAKKTSKWGGDGRSVCGGGSLQACCSPTFELMAVQKLQLLVDIQT